MQGRKDCRSRERRPLMVAVGQTKNRFKHTNIEAFIEMMDRVEKQRIWQEYLVFMSKHLPVGSHFVVSSRLCFSFA